MKTTRGVNNEDIVSLGFGFLERTLCHTNWVNTRARLLSVDINIELLAERLQLIHRARALEVASG
jgi:hypothetical protein